MDESKVNRLVGKAQRAEIFGQSRERLSYRFDGRKTVPRFCRRPYPVGDMTW
jgi:hypothetical protein